VPPQALAKRSSSIAALYVASNTTRQAAVHRGNHAPQLLLSVRIASVTWSGCQQVGKHVDVLVQLLEWRLPPLTTVSLTRDSASSTGLLGYRRKLRPGAQKWRGV
jgi:hypothetical protein